MSASLPELEQAASALRAALDADDIVEILAATAALKAGVASARDTVAIPPSHGTRPLIERILHLLESAQGRVNFLTDLTQRRLGALNAARGMAAATYSRRR